jgi:hypothetical protein
MSSSLPEDRTCRVIITAYDVQLSKLKGGIGGWARFSYYPAVAICTDGVVIGRTPRDIPGVDLAAEAVGFHDASGQLFDLVQDNVHFMATKLSNLALRRAVKKYGDYITSQQILDALGPKARLIPIAHITKVSLTPLTGVGGKPASMLMEFEALEFDRFASRAPLTTAGYLEDELRLVFGNRLVVKPEAFSLHPERG